MRCANRDKRLADPVDEMARCLLKWYQRDPMTQDEIATVCGCHRSAVYKIEMRAMEKLRKAMGVCR